MRNILRNKLSYLLLAAFLVLPLTGCGLLPTEEVPLPPPLVAPAIVTYETIEVELGDIENYLNGIGQVAPAQKTDVYFTTTSGQLKKLYVKNGDDVKKGDLLCELDTEGISLKYQEAVMQNKIDEMEWKLTQQAHKDGNIDEISWERAKLANYYREKAFKEIQSAYLDTKLYAPCDGRIIYVTGASIGGTIKQMDVVAVIADVSALYCRFSGYNYEKIPLNAKVDLNLLYIDGNHLSMTGTVVAAPSMSTDSVVTDENAKSLLIEFDEVIRDDTPLGTSVQVSYLLEKAENTVVIPRYLIKPVNTRTFVNILVDGFRQECDVKVGIQNSDSAQILSGLLPGMLLIK